MLGTTLGHYHIQAALGHGGMGEVYRAFDPRLDRVVAIKVMAPETAMHAPMVERFLREARAASALNHPNIVTIHEIGQTEAGQYYIVQELVEGQTLRKLLDGRLPPGRVSHVGGQLAKALATAHAAGIVHRDIKPENVMVRPDGYIKVLDFGLARVLGPDADTMDRETVAHRATTGTGSVLGTTAYMSPEQVRGKSVNASSDIFSFGIVLYEMLAGRQPFVGESAFLTLAAIVNEHPIPLMRLDPDLPVALNSIVMAMLAKDPANRPSALDVSAALDEILDVAAIPVAAPSAHRRQTVGRDAERRALLSAFEETASGAGLMLAVAGEPGIGKTSLVEDALNEIALGATRPVIARGKCSERLAGAETYLPVLEMLDSLLHGGTVGGFSEMMRVLAPTWYVQVAPVSGETLSTNQIREEVKSASQERMKRELAAFVQEVARVRPLVLFLDDLHWADVSTVDVLNYLTLRCNETRLLTIVTYRPSEMMLSHHPFLQVKPDLQSRDLFRELNLEFLTLDDVERYLALQFRAHELPDAFAKLIHDKTEGSPLFMVDLVRYLRDRGAIAEERGHLRLARSLVEIERELPETVKSTIGRKIEQLEEADRRLLTAASVQGHEFDAIVVAEVVGVDPADVEERLEALDRMHGFLRLVGTRETSDRTLTVRYRFVHVLYQNVLYASLQPTRRASLSGKVAQSLLAHEGAQASGMASELALLYEAARDFGKAAHYFYLAAVHALPLFAYHEAVLLCRRGLAMVKALPESPERAQQELGLQVILGLSLRSVEGWAAPQVEQIYARARELCHQLGNVPELFPVLWSTTLFHAIRGDLRIFEPLAMQLLTQAEQTGRPELLVAGHQMRASVLEFLGRTADSSHHFEQAVALHDPARHAEFVSTFGLDPGMIARSLSVRPLWFLGFADRALARIQETVAMARAQHQPISLVFAICLAQNVCLLRQEAEQTIALGAEQIALCREYRPGAGG